MIHGDPQTQSNFIREISESPRLFKLISHSYGNFVIQKALKIAKGREKLDLIASVEGSLPHIEDKKIRLKWKEIIHKSSEDLDGSESLDEPYNPERDSDRSFEPSEKGSLFKEPLDYEERHRYEPVNRKKPPQPLSHGSGSKRNNQ